MPSHNTELICSGEVRDMIPGTRVFWMKESASFQPSADVGRHRLAFIDGDRTLWRVAVWRNIATADAVRVECCSVSAEFELTEEGGERISQPL